MVKIGHRLCSVFLVVLLLINMLSTNFVIFADETDTSATERAANFLNFYQNSEETLLDMANLTTNDYYAMFNFMSNWFKPGTTTLADVYNADTSFFTDFSSAMGKSGNEKLKTLVQGFGKDVVEGINQGKCTIVDSSGKRVSGYGFIKSFLDAVPDSDSGFVNEYNEIKLYYESSSHLAFDLSSDAFKAAFQTVFAYNPDLFLTSTGLGSLSVLYLDAVGNLWGGTTECVTAGYDWDNEFNKGNALDINKLDEVFLILPACLNPSAFTPSATSTDELRMPLMNRFVLSALVTKEDLTNTSGSMEFSDSFIPIFDALSHSNDLTKNNILNVVGVHALSPYTFNTTDIDDYDWAAGSKRRRQNFADFVYNPNSFVVDRDGLKENGIAQYTTYSYIVFAMSLEGAVGKNGNVGSDGVIDLSEGFTSIFGGDGDLAFDLFDATDAAGGENVTGMENVQKFLTYFLNPTILDLNEVSMNFYKYSGTDTSKDLATQFQEYLAVDNGSQVRKEDGSYAYISELGEDGLTSSEVSKLGLSGMSLYLNDIKIALNISDGTNEREYYLLSPDNMTPSKLANNLRNLVIEDNFKKETYDTLLTNSGKLGEDKDILNLFYKTTSHKLSSMSSLFKLDYLSIPFVEYYTSKTYLKEDNYKKYIELLEQAGMTPFIKTYSTSELSNAATNYLVPYDFLNYTEETLNLAQSLGGVVHTSGSSGLTYTASPPGFSYTHEEKHTNNSIPLMSFFVLGNQLLADGSYSETVYTGISDLTLFLPYDGGITFLGSSTLLSSNYTVLGRLLGARDELLHSVLHSNKYSGETKAQGYLNANFTGNLTGADYMTLDIVTLNEYLFALYAYNLFFPSNYLFGSGGSLMSSTRTRESLSLFGNTDMVNETSGIAMRSFNQDYLMGMYLGYMVDMMGLGTCSATEGLSFGSFSSPYLPKYTISAKGGNLELPSYFGGNSNSGVNRTDANSFEEMQKNLIYRIWEILTADSSDYRNSLIESILDGIFLTFHRTITGTWGAAISTVSTGNSNTYQSVTGYIYTPVLEELPFTAVMLDNYLQIYIICMMLIIFLIVLMVLLHIRTWQQGVLTCLIMSLALLFPYVLISNSINLSNRISDSIYSDRFTFWALTEHYQTNQSLQSTQFLDEKDQWFVEANATEDTKVTGNSGVKVKWMSPKKVDMFQQMYSDSQYSDSFATNMQIFKWLFSSFIYDSEFVDTDVYGSYLYREYRTLAAEANSYYRWSEKIRVELNDYATYTYADNDYSIPTPFKTTLEKLGDENAELFSAGIGRMDTNFYLDGTNGSKLVQADEKLADIKKVSQSTEGNYASTDEIADKIGMWGMLSDSLNSKVISIEDDKTNKVNPGVVSNLPQSSSDGTYFDDKDVSSASLAIFLKNTESPYYYFYSVLKQRYSEGTAGEFRQALLRNDMFRVTDTTDNPLGLNSLRSVNGAIRDFLDLEGLFEYVIPYLKLSNDYVEEWQKVNGSKVESFNFQYAVDETTGDVKDVGVTEDGVLLDSAKGEDGTSLDSKYQDAVKEKNARNRVWNMYSPWVDSLYDLDTQVKRVTVGTNKVYIEDTLNPSSYIKEGRPMIFSEADMIIKGYSYKDLTDVEKKIQAVLENTRKDLLYLLNYYSFGDDSNDEVLLAAAAMFATFNFNAEFSENYFLKPSVMLYPQSFELRNFNYDAYMRLALYNATGESIFATDDLYERVLDKTSFITGIAMLICDFIACVAIPAIKFVILVALLFLGVLVCIACAINPPEKIMDSVLKYILLPTVFFTILNIAFAWSMSLVVGEGLTAYVGSKTVSFATNDPTMTLFLMAFMGFAYLYFGVKILKLIIDAYKRFGLSTVVAGVGVVSSALATGAMKVTKKTLKFTGKTLASGATGVGGAIVGAATAEKGMRLAGAYEGLSYGTKGMISRRIAEKRRFDRERAVSQANADSIVRGINAKASASKEEIASSKEISAKPVSSGTPTDTSPDVVKTDSTPPVKQAEGELKSSDKEASSSSNKSKKKEKAEERIRQSEQAKKEKMKKAKDNQTKTYAEMQIEKKKASYPKSTHKVKKASPKKKRQMAKRSRRTNRKKK